MRYTTRLPFAPLVLLASWIILLAAVSIAFVLTDGFLWPIGIFLAAILFLFWGIVITIAHVVIWAASRWVHPRLRVYRCILLFPAVALATTFLVSVIHDVNPRHRFELYVKVAVPPSVKSIRIHGREYFLVDEEILDFAISPSDAEVLIKAGNFQEMGTPIPSEVLRLSHKYLTDELKTIGPSTAFKAPDITEFPDYSEQKFILLNQDRTRMLFFYVAGH
jgi:hypothetical protein